MTVYLGSSNAVEMGDGGFSAQGLRSMMFVFLCAIGLYFQARRSGKLPTNLSTHPS